PTVHSDISLRDALPIWPATHDACGDLPCLEEEVVEANDTQQRAKNDEEKNLIGGDRQERPVDPRKADAQIRDDVLERKRAVIKLPGKKVAENEIGDENEGNNR